MSGSVEVVLWLHEYELKALDKHLASNGTDVEKRMQEMLADLYSECVPFEERQAIQERIIDDLEAFRIGQRLIRV